MALTLLQAIARLTRDLYPGVWQQERMVVPARSDVTIPHIMGRVPDLVEIGDPPVVGELEGPSVEDAGDVPWSKWFNMNDLVTTALAAEVLRPTGHPLVEVIRITSATIVIRNWFEIDQDVGLLVMVRQPRVTIETDDVDGMFGVWVDFFGAPLEIAAGTNVDFIDISTYTDSLTPASWAWDFGDGAGVSVLQNPTYNYPGAAPGQYDVELQVTLSNGLVVTILKPNYVTVVA